jgi:hypothetical protein
VVTEFVPGLKTPHPVLKTVIAVMELVTHIPVKIMHPVRLIVTVMLTATVMTVTSVRLILAAAESVRM